MNIFRNSTRVKWFNLVSFLLIAGCFLPRLMSFWGGAEKHLHADATETVLITKQIQDIQPGERVLAFNPEVTPEERSQAVEPDPETWRLIELELTGENGKKIEIRLLRPLDWIEQHRGFGDGEMHLTIDEMGVSGKAALVSVSPCPIIESGPGQVVTGTFKHYSDNLVEVHITGQSPLTCTSGHPFWSEERQEFIDASKLKQGEQVLAAGGQIALVESVLPQQDRVEVVHNLEVALEHVYFVGEQAILVHNAVSNSCVTDPNAQKKSNLEVVYVHIDKNGNVNYIGITDDPNRRAAEHRLDPEKTGTKMIVITDPNDHDHARTIEAMMIRARLTEARRKGIITGNESIRDQLQLAGLLNKNRGRDRENHSKGWLTLDIDDFKIENGAEFNIITPEK